MITRYNTKGLSREQWLALRSTMYGIGGSEIGTVLGLNPWQGPTDLFHKKIGNVHMMDFMEQSAFHGIHLEDYVAMLFQHWDGSVEGMMHNKGNNIIQHKVARVNAILVNDKYPFLFANIDRKYKTIGSKEDGILECKTLSGYVSEMWDHGVPPSHIVQVMGYMMVTGKKHGWIATLKDGRDFFAYPIEYRKETAEMIETECAEFMRRVDLGIEAMSNIRNDIELQEYLMEIQPTDADSLRYEAFLTERFKAKKAHVDLDADRNDVVAMSEYLKNKAQEKYYAEQKAEAIRPVKEKMIAHSAKTMKAPGFGRVTWAGNGFRVTEEKL